MLKDTAFIVPGLLALQATALPGWLGGSANIEERGQNPPPSGQYGGTTTPGQYGGTTPAQGSGTTVTETQISTVYKPTTSTVQTCSASTPVGGVIPSSTPTVTVYRTSE